MKKSSQSGEQSNLPGQLTSFVGRTNEIEGEYKASGY
jgi:hypothetical protein